jgi:hypothetical protein
MQARHPEYRNIGLVLLLNSPQLSTWISVDIITPRNKPDSLDIWRFTALSYFNSFEVISRKE